MDINLKDSLTNLEYLLDEFFSPTTINARKHEIQQQLNSFKNSPRSWTLCFYFLEHTSSQYVIMFALNTIESVVTEQWGSIPYAHKENLRSHLQSFLVDKGNTAPHFLRGKYAKLLVGIAKHDWPAGQYPTFFDFTLELLKSEESQLIGLVLLKTASEEFMAGGCVENGRRGELARLLQPYIPVVFEALTAILQSLGTKPRHTATATPPPSPTQPITADVTAPPILPHLVSPAAKFKPDGKIKSRQALETVQNLFSWVPINQIPPTIIKAIFNFTNISTYAQDDDDMCVLAMSTINELLYRKCTPPGSLHFFTQLYWYTMELLRDITNSPSYRIDTLDTMFMEKLSELLILMVEQHFWRLEMVDENFSLFEFLSLLYQITVQLPSMQCYLISLTIWEAFFKQQTKKNYSQAYLTLLDALLRKIQFSANCIQLKEIGNTDLNDDGETEWQVFLKATIEVIAMIAKQIPLETLQNILIPWQNCYATYRQINRLIDPNYNLICDESESEKLSFIFKDFSTLMQTLARLSPLYFDERKATCLPLINDLIEKLLECANFRFFDLKTPNRHLRDCFVDCHSEILAALKTCLIWITRNEKIPIENFKLLIDLVLPMMHDSVPVKISRGAALLFLALSNLTTAPQIVVLDNVLEFINVAPTLKFADKQTHLIVYSAVVNLLLKPCGLNLNRNLMTERFFKSLFWRFLDLNPCTNEAIIWEIVTGTLPDLTYLIDFCKDFPIVAKKQLYFILKPIIEHSVLLFPTYVNLMYTEVSNLILVFFLSVLRVLQQQLGVEGTKNSVQIFLDVAIKEHEASFFLDKLLQIFQLVIEAPGSNYKSFLPGILHLCMDNVYPFILQKNGENPDDFLALLTLLHSVLVHRWQYFYSSQVRLGFSPGFTETADPAMVEPKQLLAVLQVFGQALLDKDINIFKQSLASLEDLNAKWKLYLNVLYRYNSLSKYLNVLLDNLINKSTSLLSEDVHIAVYNMASVSFDEFFATFLPQFIQGLEGLTSIQKQVLLQNFVQYHDKDMPTFVQRLQIFVSDTQSFRLCNVPSTLVD